MSLTEETTAASAPTNFQRVASWLKACGKEPGSSVDLSVQAGCDLEESAELLRCLRVSSDGWQKVLERIVTDLEDLGAAIKSGKLIAHFPNHLRVDVLDALCDREVTGNGLAYLAGFKKDEADQEVLRSNDSKLVDGKAVILPGGKVGKGPNFSAPSIGSFV